MDPRSNRNVENLGRHIRIVLIAAVFGAVPSLSENWCCAQQRSEAKTEQTTGDLDAKIADLRIRIRQLRREWRAAGKESRTEIETQIKQAGSDLLKMQEGRRATFRAQAEQLEEDLDSTWDQIRAAGAGAAAELADGLDGLRSDWNSVYQKLRGSYDQRVGELRNELAELEKKAAVAAGQLTADLAERRSAARAEYQNEAQKLLGTYSDFIKSSEKELSRLRKRAERANAESRDLFATKADRLANQLAAEYEELRSTQQQILTKVQSYMDETAAQLENTSDEVATSLRTEMQTVTRSMSELYTQMIVNYEAYAQELDRQIADLEERAATADAETKDRLNKMKSKLLAKRRDVEKELADDYEATAFALEREIARLKAQSDGASDEVRAKAIKLIDHLEAELAAVKKRLAKE